MITNGPRMRLNNAPGRRMTSVTSLPTNEASLVQLLRMPKKKSLSSARKGICLRVIRLLASDELREHLVVGRAVLRARSHVDALLGDGLQHPWGGSAGVFGV